MLCASICIKYASILVLIPSIDPLLLKGNPHKGLDILQECDIIISKEVLY